MSLLVPVWTVILSKVVEGKIHARSLTHFFFEEDDLYLIPLNRTENVAFVELIMWFCAKMQIYYNF